MQGEGDRKGERETEGREGVRGEGVRGEGGRQGGERETGGERERGMNTIKFSAQKSSTHCSCGI